MQTEWRSIVIILDKTAENDDLQWQAQANNANQFAQSPQLLKSFLSAVVDAMTNYSAMSEKLLQDQHLQAEMIELIVPEPYTRLNMKPSEGKE